MSDVVSLSREGQIARLILNRPERHNAVNVEMFAQLAELGRSLAADRSVRAVVLVGNGASFCAGIDIEVFQQADAAELPALLQPADDSPANFFQRAALVWREINVPVIAALHGSVFGAGLQIALGADLRIAGPDSKLSIMEVKWGLIPDMGITQTLLPLLPADQVKALTWSGRVIDAAEARALGLVTALADDPGAAALQLADTIAARSPSAIRAAKTLLDDAPGMSAAAALQLEAKLQGRLMGAPHQREAVQANLEKRPAVFDD